MINLKTSIITPAFIDNEDKLQWLNEMVNSVLQQTRQEWELIIIDDGSPIPINDYNDNRIKVYRLENNMGVSIARNTAVNMSTGDLLLPLDSDDLLHQNALELLYNNWEPKRFVYGNVDLLSSYDGPNNWKIAATVRLPIFDCDLILNPTASAPVTCLHLKESWRKAGGWKPELCDGLEDVEYWISIVRTSCTLGYRLDQSTLIYRKHDNSRTMLMRNSNNENNMRQIIKDIHKINRGADMSCGGGCGGGGSRPAYQINGPMTSSQQTKLSQQLMKQANSEDDFIEIQYVGPRGGSFGVVGNKTRYSYKIKGTGHKFPVHKDDLKRFLIMGRRSNKPDFIELGPYRKDNDNLISQEEVEREFKPNAPIIAKITKSTQSESDKISHLNLLDNVITQLHSAPVNDSNIYSIENIPCQKKIKELLIENTWSIEKLALAGPGSLLEISGVTRHTEDRILRYARNVYFSDVEKQ